MDSLILISNFQHCRQKMSAVTGNSFTQQQQLARGSCSSIRAVMMHIHHINADVHAKTRIIASLPEVQESQRKIGWLIYAALNPLRGSNPTPAN